MGSSSSVLNGDPIQDYKKFGYFNRTPAARPGVLNLGGGGNGVPIRCVSLSADGDNLLIGQGNTVSLLVASTGKVLRSYPRDIREAGYHAVWPLMDVYCVAFPGKNAPAGRFAVAGRSLAKTPNAVLFRDTLPYANVTHRCDVQALAYNNENVLCTVSGVDFGITGQAGTRKTLFYPMKGRLTCCTWSDDCRILAIGTAAGDVTLFESREYKPLNVISYGAFVRSLAFDGTMLFAGIWNQSISCYNVDKKGNTEYKSTINLGFDPLCFAITKKKKLLVSGSSYNVTMWSYEGKQEKEVAYNGTVWSLTASPTSSLAVLSTATGALHSLVPDPRPCVALYEDIHASTVAAAPHVVPVRNFTSGSSFNIICNAAVLKCAVYKNTLAVQLPTFIVIYTLHWETSPPMAEEKARFPFVGDIKLLLVAAEHVLLYQDEALTSFNFMGKRGRSWRIAEKTTYIRVIGGEPGKELVCFGVESGTIRRIYVDSSALVTVLRHRDGIKSMDMSFKGDRVAVIDNHNVLTVYNADSQLKIYTIPEATSVVFCASRPDTLAWSVGKQLFLRSGTLEPIVVPAEGVVVGWKGDAVILIKGGQPLAIKISIDQHLNSRDALSSVTVPAVIAPVAEVPQEYVYGAGVSRDYSDDDYSAASV